MGTMAQRWELLRERIEQAARRAGRDPREIRIVAVSKTVGAGPISEAAAAGATRFGESRAAELAAKAEELADLALDWHFVGHLQTNKVRIVAPWCRLIHSLDRLPLARRIDERAPEGGSQAVLVQVSTSGKAAQSGVAPDQLPALLDALVELPRLRVEGLMTIGPLTEDRGAVRAAFRLLREAARREREVRRPRQPLAELSMGMSGDYELAVEEGATLLRIGTALFGRRD